MIPYLVLTIYLGLVVIATATAHAADPSKGSVIASLITQTRTCQDQLGVARSASGNPWRPHSTAFREWQQRRWTRRLEVCRAALHRVADINRTLYRLAVCETGGINGGVPLWTHRARSEHPGHYYEGSLGFLDSTWDQFKPAGFPDGANQASAAQQYVVGRILIARYHGYSSWPACHIRLGLPG